MVRIGCELSFEERRTAVGEPYHVLSKNDRRANRKLGAELAKRGQPLLGMLDLIGQCRLALDDLMYEAGRTQIELLLEVSAQEAAGGPRTPGKKREVCWYGRQQGRVCLRERKLAVRRPRLRRDNQEVPIPVYEQCQQDQALGERMLDILMRGVSTRQYEPVLPEMADSVGISRSAVSRETIEASEAELQKLLERPLDELELLILYVDGMCFSEHHVIGAVGVDAQGNKHVLGIQPGATENAAAVEDLLTNLVARGLNPKGKYLFVIDGSKALRAAIRKVLGGEQPVQRCRAHKLRNVLERIPKEERNQVRAAMRAAWRLEWKDGMLRKLSEWLEADYPAAASSLLEGLEECYTVNRLGLPASLHRCLATTNLIESPQSGVRMRTRRVTRWRDADMVMRWVASAFLATEQNFRKIQGYKDLWMLKAILNGSKPATRQAVA